MQISQAVRIPQKKLIIPTVEQVEEERKRLLHQRKFRKALFSTIWTLVVVAAISILTATLMLPVLQVSGTSMEPTLEDGDVIVLVKTKSFETGDLIGMRHDGKVLLKRVIGNPGDYINIDSSGNVYVNNVLLDEPYVTEKCLGDTDITFPYRVPEETWFILGDHRSVSIDSRSSLVGCIREEQIIGKVFARVYPFESLSLMQ